MTADRLVLPASLGVDARQAFVWTASKAIEQTDTEIEIDCSGAAGTEPSLVGMLVVIARGAHRRRVSIVLVGASAQLRQQLVGADVDGRFVIRE